MAADLLSLNWEKFLLSQNPNKIKFSKDINTVNNMIAGLA